MQQSALQFACRNNNFLFYDNVLCCEFDTEAVAAT
jgi:hypothetical protein